MATKSRPQPAFDTMSRTSDQSAASMAPSVAASGRTDKMSTVGGVAAMDAKSSVGSVGPSSRAVASGPALNVGSSDDVHREINRDFEQFEQKFLGADAAGLAPAANGSTANTLATPAPGVSSAATPIPSARGAKAGASAAGPPNAAAQHPDGVALNTDTARPQRQGTMGNTDSAVVVQMMLAQYPTKRRMSSTDGLDPAEQQELEAEVSDPLAEEFRNRILCAKLVNGGVFFKHGRRSAAYRMIWCSADLRYVYWADLRRGPASERAQNASSHSSVRTVDLKGIYLGFSCPQSEAFSRMDKNDERAESCFTIAAKSRTLDLECVSSQDRDLWFFAFQHLLFLRDNHKLPPASTPDPTPAPVKASESKNKVSAAAAAPSSSTAATPDKAATPAVTAAADDAGIVPPVRCQECEGDEALVAAVFCTVCQSDLCQEHFDLLHMSKTMKTHRSVLMSAKSAVAPAAGTGAAAEAGADGKTAADQQKAENKGSAGRAIKGAMNSFIGSAKSLLSRNKDAGAEKLENPLDDDPNAPHGLPQTTGDSTFVMQIPANSVILQDTSRTDPRLMSWDALVTEVSVLRQKLQDFIPRSEYMQFKNALLKLQNEWALRTQREKDKLRAEIRELQRVLTFEDVFPSGGGGDAAPNGVTAAPRPAAAVRAERSNSNASAAASANGKAAYGTFADGAADGAGPVGGTITVNWREMERLRSAKAHLTDELKEAHDTNAAMRRKLNAAEEKLISVLRENDQLRAVFLFAVASLSTPKKGPNHVRDPEEWTAQRGETAGYLDEALKNLTRNSVAHVPLEDMVRAAVTSARSKPRSGSSAEELAASGVLVFGADPNAKAPARKRRSVAEKAKEHDRQMQEYFRDDSNYCDECQSHIKGMYCHTCKKDLCISCSAEIHKSDLTSWHKRIAIFKKNDFLETVDDNDPFGLGDDGKSVASSSQSFFILTNMAGVEKNMRQWEIASLLVHGGKNAKLPQWVSDDTCEECMECATPFSVTTRRHHCRLCGGLFCNSCSSKRHDLEKFTMQQKVRVCDKCFEVLEAAKRLEKAGQLNGAPAAITAPRSTGDPLKQPLLPVSGDSAAV